MKLNKSDLKEYKQAIRKLISCKSRSRAGSANVSSREVRVNSSIVARIIAKSC